MAAENGLRKNIMAVVVGIGAVLLAMGTAQFSGLAFLVAVLLPVAQLLSLMFGPPAKEQGTNVNPQEAEATSAEPATNASSDSPGCAWRPFPWDWVPVPVSFAFGAVMIAFIAPLMAILIGSVTVWMNVLKHVWYHPRSGALRTTLPWLLRSFSEPLGHLTMKDPKNHSYLPWMIFLGIFIPSMFLGAMYRHSVHGLELHTLFLYHFFRLGPRFKFFSAVHTLAHKEGHDWKGFFKGRFQIFSGFMEWWLGPFYGVVPNNFSVGHVKIHHRWHNDVDDISTNLDLDRTKFSSFVVYVIRFSAYWTGIGACCLFFKRGEYQLVLQQLAGMVAYYGMTAVLFWWSPSFCLAYWFFAHCDAIVFLAAIAYLWHAFVDEAEPGNQYVNSMTILEGHDNVWNEDYHPVHHHCPNVHWTEMPATYEKNKHHYAAVTATIFRDCEQGMLLKWLWERNFDKMASHFVDLNDKLSHEEKKALILKRLTYIVGEKGRDGKRTEWASTASIRIFE